MKRFIRYLYEYEKNQKKRNVGFVKVEQQEGKVSISVHGKGLCGKVNENISCYLIKADIHAEYIRLIPAGEIKIGITSCGGEFCYTEALAGAELLKQGEERLAGQKEPGAEVCGVGLGNPEETFYIALWNEELYADLDMGKACVTEPETGELPEEKQAEEEALLERVLKKEQAEEESVEEEPVTEDGLEEERAEEEPMTGDGLEEERAEEELAPGDGLEEERAEEEPAPGDGLEEERAEEEPAPEERSGTGKIQERNLNWRIMKIQRGEISILPRCEWKLANNNFLLHGYYNYRHLVLIDDGKKLRLGVPGIYHEREAMAAATFGFPEFIGEEEVNVTLDSQERNQEQRFGYWCRPVRRPAR